MGTLQGVLAQKLATPSVGPKQTVASKKSSSSASAFLPTGPTEEEIADYDNRRAAAIVLLGAAGLSVCPDSQFEIIFLN